MENRETLSEALIRARRLRGWSIHGAANRMGFSSHNVLRTLEGLNPDRQPGGPSCQLQTVLTIIRTYWPDVTLDHFAEEDLLFKLVPKDPKANRRLKGYLAATG